MMSTSDESVHPVVGRILVAAVLLALLVPVSLVWWAQRSSASFADSELIGVNSLGAATVDVEIGQLIVGLEAANLAPGDSVDGRVLVRNSGTLPIHYAVVGSTDGGPLARWLSWDVWVAADCTEPVSDGGYQRRGIQLAASTPLVGNVTTGRQPGDRKLGIGVSETLCFRALLPIEAPNHIQGASTALSVTVMAEHDLEAQ